MSTESKQFWEQYQRDYFYIDMPAMLDAYVASQVAARDAEIEKRGGCIIEMSAERARLMAGIERLEAVNKQIAYEQKHWYDEFQRLRDGICRVLETNARHNWSGRDWEDIINDIHEMDDVLRALWVGSPAEPEKEAKPEQPKKKLYLIEAFDSDKNHVDAAYSVGWNGREAYVSVKSRLKSHSSWDANECDSEGNVILLPKNEEQE
jgi:hypothetical protein